MENKYLRKKRKRKIERFYPHNLLPLFVEYKRYESLSSEMENPVTRSNRLRGTLGSRRKEVLEKILGETIAASHREQSEEKGIS